MEMGSVPSHILIRTLTCLINSLNYFKNKYKLIVYTNFETEELPEDDHVTYIALNIENIPRYYNNIWNNLSFYKIKVADDIYKSINKIPVWVDLDTVVCANIDHLDIYSNFFVRSGGNSEYISKSWKQIHVPNYNYLQGNLWKASPDIIQNVFTIWNTLEEYPSYDLQDVFTYLKWHTDLGMGMNLLGDTIEPYSSASLEVMSSLDSLTPASIDIISCRFKKEGDMITALDKKILIMSFTFETLAYFYLHNCFQKFEDPEFREFLKDCGYW
jgi:hypothetical protein